MNDDLILLQEAARAAGEIGLGHWRRAPQVWDKGDGMGPVTEADIAVDGMLRETLMAARPGYGWLSEETADTPERLEAERVFIVDPIDGTRSFIEGDTTWAHSLAVVEQGQVVAAAIYLPATEKMYAAARGHGATLNDAAITVSPREDITDAKVLAARPAMDGQHWQNGAPPFKRQFRASLAYRLSLVGEGRFDAMLTLRETWEWDIAAGTLIVEEAGGRVSDRLRQPLAFNNPRPKLAGVVAGGPGLHKALTEALV